MTYRPGVALTKALKFLATIVPGRKILPVGAVGDVLLGAWVLAPVVVAEVTVMRLVESVRDRRWNWATGRGSDWGVDGVGYGMNVGGRWSWLIDVN